MDDADVHVCCHCLKTYFSLDAYIEHRKNGCSARHGGLDNRTSNSTLTIPVASASQSVLTDVKSAAVACAHNISEYLPNAPCIDTHSSVSALSTSSEQYRLAYIPTSSQSSVTSHARDATVYQTVNVDIESETIPAMSERSHVIRVCDDTVVPVCDDNNLTVPVSDSGRHSSASQVVAPGNAVTSTQLFQSPTTSQHRHINTDLAPYVAPFDEFFTSLQLKHCLPGKNASGDKTMGASKICPTDAPSEVAGDLTTDKVVDEVGDKVVNEGASNLATPKESSTLEDRLKGIKIVNILNNLDFSSDSDLPSDVDELLDFSDDDVRGASGGKWKPSALPARGSKGKISAKLSSHMRHAGKNISNGGKWKPLPEPLTSGAKSMTLGKGQMTSGKGPMTLEAGPMTSANLHEGAKKRGGKIFAHKKIRGLTDSEDEADDDAEQEQSTGGAASPPPASCKAAASKCVTCNKTFRSAYYLATHITTSYHKRRVAAAARKKPLPKKAFLCPICKVDFSLKANYVRHLKLELSRQTSVTEEQLPDVDRDMLWYARSFQCRLCHVAHDQSDHFIAHLATEEHASKCGQLLGPVLCTRCGFVSSSVNDMLSHFASAKHIKNTSSGSPPCVIKELRSNVNCPVCSQMCSSVTKLKLHIESRHSGQNKPNPVQKGVRHEPMCLCCMKTWRSASALEIHMARKRSMRMHQCLECKTAFASGSDLRRHYKSAKHLETALQLGKRTPAAAASSPPPDTCRLRCKFDNCKFETSTQKNLAQHYAEQHPPEARFVCKCCVYSTNHKSHYDKHLRNQKHKRLFKQMPDLVNPELNNANTHDVNDSSGMAVPKCDVCGVEFTSDGALNEHKLLHVATALPESSNHQNDSLSLCTKKYQEFVNSLPQDPSRLIRCPDCDVSVLRSSIVEHLRTHSNSKTFNCVYCRKTFTRRDTLKKHMTTRHLPVKRGTRCQHCNRTFSSRLCLQQHMLNQHRELVDFQPNFVCSHCEKGFVIKSHLLKHVLEAHNRHRRLLCPWKGCVRNFPTKTAFDAHYKLHKKYKPYLCDLCGYSATVASQLRRHKRTHTAEMTHTCEYCTYSATTQSALRRHMRIHAGANGYRCPHCEYRSSDWSRINKHITTRKDHKGLFLYNCDHCDFKCARSFAFKDHLFSAHGMVVTRSEASAIAGVYVRAHDHKSIQEGDQVLPVQEKFSKHPYVKS